MITENYRKQSKFTESHRRQATKSNSMWKNILVDHYWKLPKSTKSYGYRETVLLLSSFFLLLQLYQALPYLSGTLKAYFSARSKPTVFTNASHSLPPSQLANSKCVVPEISVWSGKHTKFYRQTGTLIAILCSPTGSYVIIANTMYLYYSRVLLIHMLLIRVKIIHIHNSSTNHSVSQWLKPLTMYGFKKFTGQLANRTKTKTHIVDDVKSQYLTSSSFNHWLSHTLKLIITANINVTTGLFLNQQQNVMNS